MLDRSVLHTKSLNCFSDEIFLASVASLFHSLGPVQRRECFHTVTVEIGGEYPRFLYYRVRYFIFSPPLQNFHVFLPTKKFIVCFFLSRQLSATLFLVELRWPVAYFIFISVFTRIQKQFPLSVFFFVDSLVVSASQDTGRHGWVAMRFPAKITSRCIWVAIPVD